MIQIIEADQPLTVNTLFTVLYGLPGVGKTSVSFTLPKNCLLIDADTGLHRAVGKIRPAAIRIEKYADFHRFVFSTEFEKMIADRKIKSVIIDTVGTLLDDKIAPWLISIDPKNGTAMGGLSLQGWGALKTAFNALKARFQNLGLFVCCIAHAKEEGDGNNRRFELAVSGGSTDIIYRSGDLIGFIRVVGDRRIISFNPSNQWIGKNIGGIQDKDIPTSDSDQYDTFLTDVIDEAMMNISASGQSIEEFKKAIDEWVMVLNNCQKEDEFTKFITDLSAVTSRSIQVTMRAKLGAAMKKFGFKYDSETKKVVKND